MTKSWCWSVLISLSFLFFGSFVFAQQQYDFVIRDYSTTIAVEKNGDLQINESISVDFAVPKHGIFRSIPYQYRNLSGNYITAPIIQTQVDDRDWQSYKEGDNLIIKIGSPGVLIDGPQQYHINYTVRQGVRQYDGYQELYRNMMGPGWGVPILSGSFTIGFPEGVDPSKGKWFVYYGDYGMRQTLDTVTITSGMVSGYLPISLQPRQAVTIGIQFVDGSFALATPSLRRRHMLYYILYAIPVLVFIRCYRQRRRHGKDRPLPDVVSYYPPKGMTPPECIVALQGSCKVSDIVSLIYYRASQGILVIKQEEGDLIIKTNSLVNTIARLTNKITRIHYVLQRVDNQKSTAIKHMEEHERRLFTLLFAGKQEVDISTLNTLYPVLESISDQLTAEFSYAERYTTESRHAFRRFWYMVVLLVLLYVALFMVVPRAYNTYLIFFANTNELLGDFVLSYLASFVATVLVCIVFARIMYAKTPSYEQLLSSLRGYKTFIEKVEAPQLKVLLQQDPTFVDKTLPYAVVFGLASSFLKVTDQALGEVYHPVWFVGHGFHTSTMTGLSTAIDTIATSGWATPPASQGSWAGGGGFGGGGGGFSGGGGGGGGGGSW